MHTTHRTWVPFLLTGLSALILAAYIAWGVPMRAPAVSSEALGESVASGRVAPTEDAYIDEMRTVLLGYMGPNDARQVRESLLQVTVPPAFLDAHLQFVIAFGEIAEGNIPAGEARLDLARAALGI